MMQDCVGRGLVDKSHCGGKLAGCGGKLGGGGGGEGGIALVGEGCDQWWVCCHVPVSIGF